jgi:ATP-dependent Clp protease ATP-binding subunit ClpA
MSDKSDKFVIKDEELEELIFKYCRDYTALASEGRFDPITGRDEEIDHLVMILLQKGRKNAMLLAQAGVGKTAMVVGLAQKIVSGDVPDYLKGARVLEVELPSMAAGTSSRAEFQDRFLPLCKGVAERYHDDSYNKYILFIDEFHTVMPTVVGSAYAGLSEVMKTYLTVGDLQIIAATTLDEYRMFVALDAAIDRRMQKVMLSPPNYEETQEILRTIKSSYEKHHKIEIPDEEIERIVRLTDGHLRKRNQPDKSIISMDAACAYHVMTHGTGGKLDANSVRQILSIESNLHPDALEGEDG